VAAEREGVVNGGEEVCTKEDSVDGL